MLERVCVRHRETLQDRGSEGENLCCKSGCSHLERGEWLVLDSDTGKLVGSVLNCSHRGRPSGRECAICGAVLDGQPRRNSYERDLADATTSIVYWSPA